MLPFEGFKEVFEKWLRISSILIGHNIFDSLFRINPTLVIVYIGMVTFSLATLYTIYAYEITLGLQCLVFFAVGGQVSLIAIKLSSVLVWLLINLICISKMQGLIKSYGIISNRKVLIHLKDTLEKIYKKNNSETIDCMHFCAMNSIRLIKAMMILYCLCSIAFLTWPVAETAWTGQFKMFLAVRLPGIDPSTHHGRIILTSFHAYMISIGGFGLGFMDGLYSIFTLNILVFSGLIRGQKERLNKVLETPKHLLGEVAFMFRNFIRMHQEMDE